MQLVAIAEKKAVKYCFWKADWNPINLLIGTSSFFPYLYSNVAGNFFFFSNGSIWNEKKW